MTEELCAEAYQIALGRIERGLHPKKGSQWKK